MGQRAQILVQTISHDGFTVNTMYHVQWGQGRVLMMFFMKTMLNTQLRNGQSINDICKLSQEDGVIDITECMTKEIINKVNFDDLNSVKSCFDECENEEGAMVIQIYEDLLCTNRIGFLLNDPKGISIIPKYVKPNVYMKKHGYGYVGTDFKKSFIHFAQSMDVDIMIS